MRTIKFRGIAKPILQNAISGKMVFGSLVENEVGDLFILTDKGDVRIDKDTVGQFVIQTPKDRNKFDKDGNYADFYDLYEDDIVQARESFVYYNSVYPFQCKKGDKFVLSHYDAGFCLVPIKTYKNWDKDGRSPIMGGIIDNYELWKLHVKFVPIGNIHDNKNNKELLKKEE